MSTYTPLSSQTLTAAAASVTFSGIPQTYTDLVIIANAGAVTNNSPGLRVRFNEDTSSLYSSTRLRGNGTNAASTRNSGATFIEGGNYDTGFPTFANGGFAWICNVMNYSNTTTNKTMIARYNAAANETSTVVGLYRSTSAITSITISVTTDNFASGSSFTLYGIGAGSPKAFGGDIVVNDGTYWYHAFTSSGQFSPIQSLSCDVLVVAGGGGSAGDQGAGSGAGGLLAFTSQALTNQNYTVTVGAGGTGNTSTGTQGSDSQFGSLTLVKGGGRGQTLGGSGTAGGSGSGGFSRNSGTGGSTTGGLGESGQGNNGGTGGNYAAGGGGGAGAVGGNSTVNSDPYATQTGGNGGAGSSAYSSWGSATLTGQNVSGTYWYAGGGGGSVINVGTGKTAGTGGNGGGAAASVSGVGSSGTANTGGGGGGGGWNSVPQSGGSGGSGIVIVRYAV